MSWYEKEGEKSIIFCEHRKVQVSFFDAHNLCSYVFNIILNLFFFFSVLLTVRTHERLIVLE